MKFTQCNLLEAPVEAVVNTVNAVGVMGKGIALMFKERFPENFKAYEAACRAKELQVGRMFVTPGMELGGPRLKGSLKGSVLDIVYYSPSFLRRYIKGSVLDIVYYSPSFLRRYKRWFR